MNKLTAGIFAGILTIVTVNAARADIATTNYVNQNVDNKVGDLGALTTTAKGNAVAAINEVKDSVDTIQDNIVSDSDVDIDTMTSAEKAIKYPSMGYMEGHIQGVITSLEGSLTGDIDKANSEIDGLKGRVQTAESEIDSLQAATDGYSASNTVATAIAGAVKTATDFNDAMDSRVKVVESSVTTLTGTGEGSVKKQISDAIDSANTANKGVTDALAGRLSTAENKIITAETNIANLQSADTALGNRITTNEEAITTLNGADTVTGSVANKIKTAVDTINTTTTGLNTRLSTAEGEIDTLQDDLDAAEETIVSHTTSITNLTNNKANSADVYTKNEIDGKVTTINTAIEGKVTATNLNNKLLTTTTAGQLQDAASGLTKPTDCGTNGITCMLINDGTGFKWEKVVDKYTTATASSGN